MTSKLPEKTKKLLMAYLEDYKKAWEGYEDE